MMAQEREFDVIVMGASGFTGQFVVEEMARCMEMDELYKHNNLKWAIAGRSREKLTQVLQTAAKFTKLQWCTKVPIIANVQVEDYPSVLAMVGRARVVISVVGPYMFYGEPIVKACVEAGTNYVDISGEPQFLESMQLKYNAEAQRKGLHIVGSAGWDSLPADICTTFAKQQVESEGGELGAAEIFVLQEFDDDYPGGPMLNEATYQAAIHGFAQQANLKSIRRKLYTEVLPLKSHKPNYSMPKRSMLEYVKEIKGYCLPFPGSDKTVVRRSEILKYLTRRERPLLCDAHFRIESLWRGLLFVLAGILFGLLTKTAFTRSLLKRYPDFFTFGFCTNRGVPRELLAKRYFKHVVVGYGWDRKLADPDMQHAERPKKKIVTSIRGPDAPYLGTSILVVNSAMTLIFDREKLCPPGVVTPGVAFQHSYLVDRLAKRAIELKVVERVSG